MRFVDKTGSRCAPPGTVVTPGTVAGRGTILTPTTVARPDTKVTPAAMATAASIVARVAILALTVIAALAGLFAASPAVAGAVDETRVVVRAVSRGAKVIGDTVGGARIIVRDVVTGEVLAEAVQRGSTGSTGDIMGTPHRVGEAVYSTAPSAHVEFAFDVDEPRQVEVIAEAPLGVPSAMQRASQTVWLFPGRHLVGEGVVIELPGLVALLEEPRYRTVVGGADTLAIEAKVTML